MRINLGDELCYIAFVCAQFGYTFSKSLVSRFFIESRQQASKCIEELIDFGILQHYDKSYESLQFSHDIIFRESRSLYNEERLHNVNFKLFNVFSDSSTKTNDEIESTKKAVALIRSGQKNRNSLPSKLEINIYLKALEYAVSNHFVDQGFFIAQFIDLEIPFNTLDDNTRFKLCQKMTLIAHYQNNIEFCIHITDKTALHSEDPLLIAQLHSNLGNILFSRIMLHDAAERFQQALASIGINQRFKAGKLSIVEAGLAFLKIHRNSMGLKKYEENDKTCFDNKVVVENKILCISTSATISVDTFFGAKAISRVLKNTIQHGFTNESVYALMLYAVGSVSHLRDYKKAVLYAEYCFFKLSQYNNSYYLSRSVFLYHCFIGVHRNTIKGNVSAIHDTIYTSLKESSVDFAAYAAHVASFHRLDSDSPLNEVCFWLDNYKKLLAPYEQNNTAMWMSVLQQAADDLQSRKAPNNLMDGAHFSIIDHLDYPLKINIDRSLVFISYHYRSVLNVLFKNWRNAVEDCNVASKYRIGVIGTYGEHLHKFIEGIAQARLSINDNKVGIAKSKLKTSIKFLTIPTSIGSIVVKSKLALLQGYYSLLNENINDAKKQFQQSIILAEENGHILDKILGLDAMILVSNKPDQEGFQLELINTINKWGGDALLAFYSRPPL